MTSTTPFRVVVAGGGVAGIEALLALHGLAGDRVELTLVDAQPNFVYKPLLVADLFLRDRVRHVSMAEVARDTGARLVPDVVASVDDRDRVVVTQGGERLRYDALLLATGVTSVPAYRHALTWDERSGNERIAGLLSRHRAGPRAAAGVRRPARAGLAAAGVRARAHDRAPGVGRAGNGRRSR